METVGKDVNIGQKINHLSKLRGWLHPSLCTTQNKVSAKYIQVFLYYYFLINKKQTILNDLKIKVGF